MKSTILDDSNLQYKLDYLYMIDVIKIVTLYLKETHGKGHGNEKTLTYLFSQGRHQGWQRGKLYPPQKKKKKEKEKKKERQSKIKSAR